MIPNFDENGYLPPGIWNATLQEVQDRFTQTVNRRQLFDAFRAVVEVLRASNCPELYLKGSFITDKAEPGDYDMCYEPTGMGPTAELYTFLQLTPEERKKQHLGDIFIRLPEPPFFHDHVRDWQTDREDIPKGIIRITLRQDGNA